MDGTLELTRAKTAGRLHHLQAFVTKLQLKTFDATPAQLAAINAALDGCQRALNAATDQHRGVDEK